MTEYVLLQQLVPYVKCHNAVFKSAYAGLQFLQLKKDATLSISEYQLREMKTSDGYVCTSPFLIAMRQCDIMKKEMK